MYIIKFIYIKLITLFYLAELDKGDIDGLDFWDQTKDFLEPVLDKNNTYSAVYIKILINCYKNKI
jgi:hypothetical protein